MVTYTTIGRSKRTMFTVSRRADSKDAASTVMAPIAAAIGSVGCRGGGAATLIACPVQPRPSKNRRPPATNGSGYHPAGALAGGGKAVPMGDRSGGPAGADPSITPRSVPTSIRPDGSSIRLSPHDTPARTASPTPPSDQPG